MAKMIQFGEEARRAMQSGVDKQSISRYRQSNHWT